MHGMQALRSEIIPADTEKGPRIVTSENELETMVASAVATSRLLHGLGAACFERDANLINDTGYRAKIATLTATAIATQVEILTGDPVGADDVPNATPTAMASRAWAQSQMGLEPLERQTALVNMMVVSMEEIQKGLERLLVRM